MKRTFLLALLVAVLLLFVVSCKPKTPAVKEITTEEIEDASADIERSIEDIENLEKELDVSELEDTEQNLGEIESAFE